MDTQTPAGVTAPAGGFQNGGWYGGEQYWNGTWSQPGQINSQSNQQGAGQMVSQEVNNQSAAQQGVSNNQFTQYLTQQQAQANQSGNSSGNSPTPLAATSGATNTTSGSGLGNGTPQTPDLQSIYNSAYTNNPDVIAAQKSIQDLNSQITARQQALAKAQADINDNPFYSEATRGGKVKQLNDEAQNDINTLNNQLKVQQDTLTNAQAEADRQVNLSTGQYNINRQAYQDSLSQLNEYITTGAISNASSSDLAKLSVSTGLSVDMLKGIQQAAQSKAVAPQIVTSTDNAGNLTIATVDKNTGKVINEQTLNGVGKAKSSGSSTSKNDIISWAHTDAANGKTLNDMMSYYSGYLTPQEIYDIYHATNYYKATPAQQTGDKKQYNVK